MPDVSANGQCSHCGHNQVLTKGQRFCQNCKHPLPRILPPQVVEVSVGIPGQTQPSGRLLGSYYQRNTIHLVLIQLILGIMLAALDLQRGYSLAFYAVAFCAMAVLLDAVVPYLVAEWLPGREQLAVYEGGFQLKRRGKVQGYGWNHVRQCSITRGHSGRGPWLMSEIIATWEHWRGVAPANYNIGLTTIDTQRFEFDGRYPDIAVLAAQLTALGLERDYSSEPVIISRDGVIGIDHTNNGL